MVYAIAIGADHGDCHLKEELKSTPEKQGHTVLDVGAFHDRPSDYPDFCAGSCREKSCRKR